MKFRFQEQTKQGLWTSPGVFEADYPDIVRMIHKAHRIGHQRAAIEVDTLLIIYGVDSEGKATRADWAGTGQRRGACCNSSPSRCL